MEQASGEVVEEKESKGAIREHFRRLLCTRKPSYSISYHEPTLNSMENDVSLSRKRIHKRSIQVDYKNEEIYCLPRSPSSPFIDYSSTNSSRKAVMKQTGSLENCFVFDEFNQEGLDLSDMSSNNSTKNAKIISISAARSTNESLFGCNDVEPFSGANLSIKNT